jgi:pimeloyl-ACP methyl ester carboxylesterase
MSNFEIRDLSRRDLLVAGTAGLVAGSLAGAGKSVAAAAPPASPAALGPIKQVSAGELNVGYLDIGPSDGPVAVLLHGFPYDIHSFVDVAPALAAEGYRVIVPHLRGHGTTTFIEASGPRSGEQAAIGQDLVDLLDALKIERAVLAGYDWGGRAACVVAALWPERCLGLVSVNGYLIQDISKATAPAPARVERGIWYQYYLLTERGRAGLTDNRNDIARIMWHDNSPTWKFDDAVFERSARSFDNPAYVDVVVHSYRHRLGAEAGVERYAHTQRRLAGQPTITVPTFTLDGDSDGVVPATDGRAAASKFSGPRTHRVIKGAGHNLPQEAPLEFVRAVLDLASR